MTDDFFRTRRDQMTDLKHPLAVLGSRLPWAQLEAALAPAFARKSQDGKRVAGNDLFGSTLEIAGSGIGHAERLREADCFSRATRSFRNLPRNITPSVEFFMAKIIQGASLLAISAVIGGDCRARLSRASSLRVGIF